MTRQLNIGILAAVLVAWPLLTFAAGNAPEIKGVWVGKTYTFTRMSFSNRPGFSNVPLLLGKCPPAPAAIEPNIVMSSVRP